MSENKNMLFDNYNPAGEKFILYLSRGILKGAEDLLDDNGEFEIQDEKNQNLKVKKKQFMDWLKSKWADSGWAEVEEPRMDVDSDICSGCNKGCKVYLLLDGTFPYQPEKSGGERVLRGMLINEHKGKVNSIATCSQFENRENPFQYQVLQGRVDEIMQETKCNYMTAYITARVEMYGKHTIDIDSDFIILSNAIDKQIQDKKLK